MSRFSYKREVEKLSRECFELRQKCVALERELSEAKSLIGEANRAQALVLALNQVRRLLQQQPS